MKLSSLEREKEEGEEEEEPVASVVRGLERGRSGDRGTRKKEEINEYWEEKTGEKVFTF